MFRVTRRHLLIALLLGFLVSGGVGILILRARSLQMRLPRVAVGMTGTEAEEILGVPRLVLSRTNGRGHCRIWVDQLWQVDILTGPDNRIERIGCVPSNSTTRRTIGWLFQ